MTRTTEPALSADARYSDMFDAIAALGPEASKLVSDFDAIVGERLADLEDSVRSEGRPVADEISGRVRARRDAEITHLLERIKRLESMMFRQGRHLSPVAP